MNVKTAIYKLFLQTFDKLIETKINLSYYFSFLRASRRAKSLGKRVFAESKMSKLDELKEKFQDFLEEVKKKIPSKKNSEDDEDFEEEFEEDTGVVDVDSTDLDGETQTGVNVEGESTDIIDDEDEEDDEDEDEEDEDEKKKKQKTLIIRGLLLVVIIYIASDLLMQPDDNVVPPPPPGSVKRNRPKRPKRPKRERNNPAKKAENSAGKEAPVEQKPTPKVVENQNVAPVNTPEQKAEPARVTTPEPITEPVPIATPAPIVTAEPSVEPITIAEPPVDEPTALNAPGSTTNVDNAPDASGIPPETPAQPMSGSNLDLVGENSDKKSLSMDEKVDQMIEKSKEEGEKKEDGGSLINNIDRKMEYVEPPNYKRIGRGLVYNCTGGHWACVDKFSYFQCRENTKWSQVNNKGPECVVKNVYASDKDCGIIQLHYININEPTEFCNIDTGESAEKPQTKVIVK